MGARRLRGARIHSHRGGTHEGWVAGLHRPCCVRGRLVGGSGEAAEDPAGRDREDVRPTGGWSGNSAPSLGQGFIVLSDLYKWKGNARGAWAGTLNASCTFVFIAPNGFSFKAQCNATANLAGGKLSILGQYYGSPSLIPIVGGTGAYTGAKGYVRLLNIGPEESSNSADTFVITG